MSAFTVVAVDANRFQLHRDGKLAGYLDYREDADTLYLDYVFVVPEMRGGEAGKAIVAAAIELAQAKNLRAEPICSYAAALMRKNNWPEQFQP